MKRKYLKLLTTLALIGVMSLSLTSTESQVPVPSDFSWEELSPAITPLGRDSQALSYDPVADKVIMFGGWTESIPTTYANDTWTFDPTTQQWANITANVIGNPGARGYITSVFDQGSNEVILFGGFNQSHTYGDTWAFNYASNTWSNLSTPVAPSPRGSYAFAYSTNHNTAILFGGSNNDVGEFSNETWSYNSAAGWNQVPTASRPVSRDSTQMAYDSLNDKFILFGGYNDTSLLNDTWVYDHNTQDWTQMDPLNAPTPRAYSTMTYDVNHEQALLFGGYDEIDGLNDTWAYDYQTNTWTNVSIPAAPSMRSYVKSTHISSTNEHFMFGGYGVNDNSLNDTWVLDWAGGTPPVTTTSTSTTSTTTPSTTTTSTTTPSTTTTSTTTPSTTTTSTTTSTTGEETSSDTTSAPLPILTAPIFILGISSTILLRRKSN